MMLLKLLSVTQDRYCEAVISLKDEGTIGPRIRELGVPVWGIGLRPIAPNPFSLFRLRKLVRSFRPDLIQGWMYHGNIAANVAARFSAHRVPVLWNIQQSLYDISHERRLTAAIIRSGIRQSHRPVFIIYNSRVSAEQHTAFGYCPSKRLVIPTGYDCELFHPDHELRLLVRKGLGVTEGEVLVGLVARYHPMKDHVGFLRAAALVSREHPQAKFAMIGRGLPERTEIRNLIAECNLGSQVLLLGERADLPRLTAALDIACSSSAWGEGFSNAVGEAMACAVPCVVTDVGDSAYAVGETGLSVPPREPQALAQAIGRLINAGHEYRQQLGRAARERIQSEFSLSSIAQRYQALYGKVLEDGIRDVHT